MLSIKVSVDRDLWKRLEPGERDRKMTGAMTETVVMLESRVAEKTPVDMGLLLGSIAHEVRGHGANLRGEVFSNRDYAPAVERGRRPGRGFPPRTAIEGWLHRHDMNPSLWYVVSRAIARRGIKAVHMFKNSADRSGPAVQGIWSKWLNRL